MKKYRYVIVLCLLFLISVQFAAAQEAILSEARQLNEKDYAKALALYNQVLEMDPSNFEAIWNAAFLYTKIGNKTSNRQEKEVQFKKAMALAQKSIDLQPNSVYSNYVYGVALGRMGDIMGAKERVQNATKIKERIEAGLKIDPKHAASWHILGRLHYRLDNLNMAEKAAAAVLFGGLPKGVSTEKAAECYTEASNLRPDYILYRLDLAVALIKLDKKAEAKASLQKAITLSPITEDDPQYLEDCKSLLKRL